jgi:hypothetical protein
MNAVSAPPIFVVGCPRSGTTLLRDLIRSDPSVEIPPESHFIPAFYRAWGDPASDREARALARRMLSLRTVRRWGLDLEPEGFASCRSYADVVGHLFGEFARAEGASRWGDKSPRQVRELPLLAQLFPDARFLHIIRDGRDVALSWVPRPFGPGNVYGAAKKWQSMVTAGRRDAASLGERYLEIRYESLLTETRSTMERVCRFIDVPFSPAMLTRAERSAIYSRNKSPEKRAWEAEIRPDNVARWRREMSGGDRGTMETVAGETLSDLGYELEGLARPMSLPARAWRTAHNRRGEPRKRLTRRQFSLGNRILLGRAELTGRFRSPV